MQNIANTLVKNTYERVIHKNDYKNETHWGPYGDPLNPLIDPIVNTVRNFKHAPANSMDIPFAEMANASYHPGTNINDYVIDKSESTVDRTVYVHNNGKHAVIAFRGTDPKNWRDVTTDALLGLEQKTRSHRFWNAEQVTKRVIQKYGKNNVYATGHSLGGSEALHVSNKFGIHAEAYNPFITFGEYQIENAFDQSVIHYNVSDPVAAGVPFVHTKKTYYHYNTKSWPGFGQHSISNIVEQSKRERKTNILNPTRKPDKQDIPSATTLKPQRISKPDKTRIKQSLSKQSNFLNPNKPIQQESQAQVTTFYKPKTKKLYFGLEELIYT